MFFVDGFLIEANKPTMTPTAKLPKIMSTLDNDNFQNKNLISVTSTF